MFDGFRTGSISLYRHIVSGRPTRDRGLNPRAASFRS
jgi:hypothetical protein